MLFSYHDLLLPSLLFSSFPESPLHTHTHTHTHTQGYGYQAAMAGFYLGTMLSSRFTNSGAFEVAFDGALLFSRLATGAFPVPADIAGLVKEGLAAGGHA